MRYGLLVLSLIVPGLLCVNAWQGYRYNQLSNDVASLESQQQDLLEANRDALAEIAYEKSPGRIEEKALKSFTLVPVDQGHVTRVLIESPSGRQGQ
ncbi:MAG TPA: hypothetical protein VL354_02885 [Spirochaetia bacterium]|nr:hypothetical protein [Spirochaetia bacterium]